MQFPRLNRLTNVWYGRAFWLERTQGGRDCTIEEINEILALELEEALACLGWNLALAAVFACCMHQVKEE